jgi:hypothetical protein
VASKVFIKGLFRKKEDGVQFLWNYSNLKGVYQRLQEFKLKRERNSFKIPELELKKKPLENRFLDVIV